MHEDTDALSGSVEYFNRVPLEREWTNRPKETAPANLKPFTRTELSDAVTGCWLTKHCYSGQEAGDEPFLAVGADLNVGLKADRSIGRQSITDVHLEFVVINVF